MLCTFSEECFFHALSRKRSSSLCDNPHAYLSPSQQQASWTAARKSKEHFSLHLASLNKEENIEKVDFRDIWDNCTILNYILNEGTVLCTLNA